MLQLSFCEAIPLPPVGESEKATARSNLHNLVSQAGQIGFRDLSNAARELGAEIAAGNLHETTITNFENARKAAQGELGRRIAS